MDSTILSFVALLCAGMCCLVAAAGIVLTIWFLMRGTTTNPPAEQDAYGGRALPTTPPEQRRPRREPAAETSILPAHVSGDDQFPDDDIETVVANAPAPPRTPIQLPRLPNALGESVPASEPATPADGKKPPKSSGQTIIAFDDDDEDW